MAIDKNYLQYEYSSDISAPRPHSTSLQLQHRLLLCILAIADDMVPYRRIGTNQSLLIVIQEQKKIMKTTINNDDDW